MERGRFLELVANLFSNRVGGYPLVELHDEGLFQPGPALGYSLRFRLSALYSDFGWMYVERNHWCTPPGSGLIKGPSFSVTPFILKE